MRISYSNVLAFFVGAIIMGVEMTASRFVAPYFGSSTFVWTNVIAVIMIALSLGYLSGGKLAEKRAPMAQLQLRLMISALFMGLTPFLAAPLARIFLMDLYHVASGSVAILMGSFLLVLLLFFIPTYLLAMTSPYLVGYEARKGKDPGKSAGQIFAVGTLGSIIGTFLAPIVLVPLIGSKRTMLVFAGALFLLTFPFLFPLHRLKKAALILVLFLPLSVSPLLRVHPNLIAQAESSYQFMQVFDIGGIRRFVFNEGGGTQSMYKPDAILAGKNYYEVLALTPTLFAPDRPLKILILGLAGGTVSREMDLLYPERTLQMTGVEIDPAVAELAKIYFDLERERLQVVTMDGRAFLNTTDERYDIIIVDAYSNQLYLPSHMVSREFFEEVRARLVDDGIVAINVNASSEDSRLMRVITNTLVDVFPSTVRTQIAQTWNYVLLGTREGAELLFQNVPAELKDMHEMTEGSMKQMRFAYDVPVFTDDWAPTEAMMDEMVWEAIVSN